MEWYQQVQFVAAVPMPPAMAAEFGTTVNGMWADPERITEETAREAHDAGRHALFSVPLIALLARVYEDPRTAHLLDSVCRDVDGGQAEATWYYWEPKPVYSACIYSEPFRDYLLALCRRGIELGMDVVNLDEIMCHTGLMSRGPKGSGFCALCLDRFRSSLGDGDAALSTLDDDALRAAIRDGDALYDRYHRFHERETFRVVVGLIEELRAHARDRHPGFAISANIGYLGNKVGDFGPLWSGIWGPHLEFVLAENDYRIEQHGPHLILPRGKFAAWYRLASAFRAAPAWICPSIHVPRQLADEDRRRYHELMFLEAYANDGRWGYYWWPGVSPETRRAATAPDAIKEHIAFIAANRDLYEGTTSGAALAILYLQGPILRRPDAHERYLGLAQALYESSFQFDVLYAGDGEFNPEQVDPEVLARYAAILVPDVTGAGAGVTAALERAIAEGRSVVVFSDGDAGPTTATHADGGLLTRFWTGHGRADREQIAALASAASGAPISVSDPAVVAVRRFADGRAIVHLVDYAYDAATDDIEAVVDLTVRVPGYVEAPACSLLHRGGRESVRCRVEAGELVIEVPRLDTYAVLLIGG